jgi:hypothetical protein
MSWKGEQETDCTATATFVASVVLHFSPCSRLTHGWLTRACSERSKEPFRLNPEWQFWHFCSQEPQTWTPPARGEPLQQAMQRETHPARRAHEIKMVAWAEENQKNSWGSDVLAGEGSIKASSLAWICFSAWRNIHPISRLGQGGICTLHPLHPQNLDSACATWSCSG